jgi:hypothetical protein
MRHLVVVACLTLFGAALAMAQYNPQTDSPHPVPTPPKQETLAPDYEAMATKAADSAGLRHSGKPNDRDVHGSSPLFATCPKEYFVGNKQQCLVSNYRGVILGFTCTPSLCTADILK